MDHLELKIFKSYHCIPINPLEYVVLLKRFIKLKQISIEELENKIDKEKNYFKHIIENHTNFAEEIKKFQEVNKIGIEETCKILHITEEQYDKYMELL